MAVLLVVVGAAVGLVVVVVFATVVGVLLADVRAAAAADAAALAAVRSSHPMGDGHATSGAAAARAAAGAAVPGALVVSCTCAPGRAVAQVVVEVPVPAGPAHALGLVARRATARATLVPP